MSCKLKLMNQNGKSIEINSGSIDVDKVLDPTDFKYIRDTVKDMLDLNEKLNDGEVIFLKGYHTINDGGGGTFVYNASGDKSTHNGGTIIDPSKVFPDNWDDETKKNNWFNTVNSDTGVLERIYSESINVLVFGSKGGTNNETIPLQKAIDNCNILVYNETTYNVTNIDFNKSNTIHIFNNTRFAQVSTGYTTGSGILNIKVNNIEFKNKVTVYGNIYTDEGEWSPALNINSVNSITIDILYAENIRGDAIYIKASSDVIIKKVDGLNCYRLVVAITGGNKRIKISNVTGYKVGSNNLIDIEPDDNYVEDIEITNVYGGVHLIGQVGSDVNNLHYINNVKISNLFYDGSAISNSDPAYFSYNNKSPIRIRLSKNVSYKNITLKNTDVEAITLPNDDNMYLNNISFENVILDNCYTSITDDTRVYLIDGYNANTSNINGLTFNNIQITNSPTGAYTFARLKNININNANFNNNLAISALYNFSLNNIESINNKVTDANRAVITGCYYGSILNSTINNDYNFGYISQITISCCNISGTNAEPPTSKTTAINCTINSNDVIFKQYYAEWNRQNMVLGEYSLWIDSNGNMRIKKGIPTSDSDGNTFSIREENETIEGNKNWSSDTLYMTNLPTSDPSVAGQLWNDNGTVKVSAG